MASYDIYIIMGFIILQNPIKSVLFEYAVRSINKELLVGPDLTNQIIGILIRFRQGKAVFVADIEKMFFQMLRHYKIISMLMIC